MYRIVVISMFKIQDPTLPSSHIEKNILELRKKDTRKKKKKISMATLEFEFCTVQFQ